MLKHAILAACLAALGTSALWADIDMPDRAKPHTPIVARLIADLPNQALRRGTWETPTVQVIAVDPDTLHIWAPPGRHTIRAHGVWVQTRDVTIDNQTLPVLVDFGFYDHSATIEIGPEPDPEPDPDPDPPPPPPGPRWALVVEETADRTPQQAGLYLALRNRYPLSRLLILDKDAEAESARRYIRAVPPDVPLPALVIVHAETGKIVRIVPLPETVDRFTEELAR
jgi:hypothetical protein